MKQLTTNQKNILRTFLHATSKECEDGVKWYPTAYEIACRISSKANNMELGKVVGTISALSPNNEWSKNCLDAERMVAGKDSGLTDKQLKEFKYSTYHDNRDKALKILDLKTPYNHKSIKKILSGPKVKEFYNCINGLYEDVNYLYKDIKFKRNLRSDVTVDGHCFSIWLGHYVPTTKTSSKIRGKRLRDQIKRDYILVTKYINEELETTYKPSDIQAITWVTHKRLNNV